jgi:LysM repeat protein
VAIAVQAYDTLDSLALAYRVSVSDLQKANCLVSTELAAGSFLYVPPLPTSTRPACGAPAGWVIYTVQPGDTLFRISLLYRVSVAQLQQANCLGASSNIVSGQQLRVPNVATSTATFTPMTPATATPTTTLTTTVEVTAETPLAPTETPTSAPTEVPSNTPAPTSSPEPSATP